MKETYFNYLKEGPSDTIAFIEGVNSCIDNILETISALSNTRGGLIFVGVAKNGKIIGVNPFEVEDFFGKLNENYFNNRIDLNFEKVNNKHLFFYVLHVKETINKPLFFKIGTKKFSYIRFDVENVETYNILNQFWKFKSETKKNSVLPNLSDEERLILSVMLKGGDFTYSKLRELVNLPTGRFEKCLVRLIYRENLSYSFDSKSIRFNVR